VNDLGLHLLLFAIVGIAIVAMGSFFGDVDDGPALSNIPRRLLVFFGGCGVVALVLLAIEHTVAAVK
jgi:hypothetical protein